MKNLLAGLGIAALLLVGAVSMSGPADAQELDLCALLGDPYCPGGVGAEGVGAGGVQSVTAAESSSDGLARTGSDVGPLVGIGGGLVAIGLAAAIGARKRSENADV